MRTPTENGAPGGTKPPGAPSSSFDTTAHEQEHRRALHHKLKQWRGPATRHDGTATGTAA